MKSEKGTKVCVRKFMNSNLQMKRELLFFIAINPKILFDNSLWDPIHLTHTQLASLDISREKLFFVVVAKHDMNIDEIKSQFHGSQPTRISNYCEFSIENFIIHILLLNRNLNLELLNAGAELENIAAIGHAIESRMRERKRILSKIYSSVLMVVHHSVVRF